MPHVCCYSIRFTLTGWVRVIARAEVQVPATCLSAICRLNAWRDRARPTRRMPHNPYWLHVTAWQRLAVLVRAACPGAWSRVRARSHAATGRCERHRNRSSPNETGALEWGPGPARLLPKPRPAPVSVAVSNNHPPPCHRVERLVVFPFLVFSSFGAHGVRAFLSSAQLFFCGGEEEEGRRRRRSSLIITRTT
jgi:hypothetical protein